MATVLKVEGLSKFYRRGTIGIGTLREDINRCWARVRLRTNRKHVQTASYSSGNMPETSGIWALKDISFEVNQGEVLGIVGMNGSGKSTLLKIISRITAPTQGTVSLRGQTGSLLEVGAGFHPELTGRENIYLNAAILGMNRAEISSKLEEIVDFANVSSVLDTPVKRYSTGMLVRLAFAIAVHLNAEILIVDEVLAVGDANFQAKCLEKMRLAAQSGRTVLFVSHNQSLIEGLCTRALVMNKGVLTHDGKVESALAEYATYDQTSLIDD
ncbi:MAG: lipopolysaccharide transport system ATP-binding protein [Arenicella sp.]|jgi:lipopolysaccharide transport system ATP-binding protein